MTAESAMGRGQRLSVVAAAFRPVIATVMAISSMPLASVEARVSPISMAMEFVTLSTSVSATLMLAECAMGPVPSTLAAVPTYLRVTAIVAATNWMP